MDRVNPSSSEFSGFSLELICFSGPVFLDLFFWIFYKGEHLGCNSDQEEPSPSSLPKWMAHPDLALFLL